MNADVSGPAPYPIEQSLESHLQDIDIPPRPAILAAVQTEMGADEPDFRRLEALISADVALAAGLVKTVNSPFFGLDRRATTVQDALMMLGLAATARAVASFSLRRAFPDTGHFERFWDASAKIAALSGWLTKRLGSLKLRADEAYTFGLFRDCGVVILMRRFPRYQDTLKTANQEREASFTEVERKHLPTDHTIVGRLMTQNWWLPDSLCEAIRYHHNLGYLSGPDLASHRTSRQLIAVSQLAEHLLQQATGASQTAEWHKLGRACAAVLDLSEHDLLQLHTEVGAQLAQIV
jgi:HD-like signal output (HDOD) protein